MGGSSSKPAASPTSSYRPAGSTYTSSGNTDSLIDFWSSPTRTAPNTATTTYPSARAPSYTTANTPSSNVTGTIRGATSSANAWDSTSSGRTSSSYSYVTVNRVTTPTVASTNYASTPAYPRPQPNVQSTTILRPAPVYHAKGPAPQPLRYISPVAKVVSSLDVSAVGIGGDGPTTASESKRRKELSPAEEIDLVIGLSVKLARASKGYGTKTAFNTRALSNAFGVPDAVLTGIVVSYPRLVRFDRRSSSMESAVQGTHLICYNYNCGSCRQVQNCSRIHVCCKWLFGKCSRVDCMFEHTVVNNARNYPRLEALGIGGWTDEQLKLLLLGLEHQISMVCRHYNAPNGCKDGENCGYFHVCAKFVDKKCWKTCDLNHRVHHCENRKKIQTRNSVKRFDEAEQLRCRLSLKLSVIPKLETLETLLPKDVPSGKASGDRSAVADRAPNAWYFFDNDGTWKLPGLSVADVSFGLHVSMILEEAYEKKALGQLMLKMGRFTYAFDEVALEQWNIQTLVARKLKRERVQLRADLPRNWMPMIDVGSGGAQAVAFPLPENHFEFRSTKDLFNAAGGIPGSQVLEIYRVQSPHHKKIYDTQKAELERLYRGAGASVTEMSLFHGTDPNAVKSICEQNFDWRRNGEAVGTVHGKGTYFALRASYSHSYTKLNSDGSRLLFVAKVLVGLKCKGDPDMKYPPAWKGNIKFDTAVDDLVDPSIFVKYESHDYYPTYLIQYTVM